MGKREMSWMPACAGMTLRMAHFRRAIGHMGMRSATYARVLVGHLKGHARERASEAPLTRGCEVGIRSATLMRVVFFEVLDLQALEVARREIGHEAQLLKLVSRCGDRRRVLQILDHHDLLAGLGR